MRRAIIVGAVVVLAAALAVPLWRLAPAERRLTAHFTRAIGIYEGSDVRVLGVRVGRVSKVTPEGRTVRVDLRYDHDLRIPADAQALVGIVERTGLGTPALGAYGGDVEQRFDADDGRRYDAEHDEHDLDHVAEHDSRDAACQAQVTH